MKKQLIAVFAVGAAVSALLISGCQNTPTNTTATNSTNANTGTPVNSAPAASPTATITSQTIETNEPEQYSGVLELTAATKRGFDSPAREGAKRRAAFNLPGGEKVVYLNQGSTRYLILPNRKQYVELKPESLGFNLPRLMMPDQIVDYLKSLKGYERVGEEQLNGRSVIKYRAVGAADTNTQAGKVQAETFVFVDKETGLPLRAELASQASRNVQGVDGLNAVIVMRDIKREVDASMFEVPQGFERISDEQVRSQVTALANAAGAILGTLLSNLNASPANSPSP